MKFLSVCSGIEAASVAWGPLGWKAVAFSEIEPFPCAVLAHHYPETQNWGDMNNFKEWPDVPIDLLCGGTPCQSFSVAGLRKGLDDPRGNLMLTFGAIAAKYRPRWLVWENVPGVLSSDEGRDFASFLGLLSGQVVEVPEGGWSNSGIVTGIPDAYGLAYRVLDAQYFGVPQRRRRVFVVGCLGDWRSAAAVLFERHSVSGYPPPRRQAGQVVTPTVRAGAGHGARSGDSKDELIVPVLAFGGNDTRGAIDVATARNACASASASGRMDFESETFLVSHSLRGEGFDASEDGTGRGTPLVPVAFQSSQSGVRIDDVHATLDSNNGSRRHNGVMSYSTKLHNTQSNQAGKVYEEYTAGLDRNSPPPALLTAMQVRRLTPMECERLQGFPDGYTAISMRGKPAADGPRYKALGNSWAIPNVRWIGRRIESVMSTPLPPYEEGNKL